MGYSFLHKSNNKHFGHHREANPISISVLQTENFIVGKYRDVEARPSIVNSIGILEAQRHGVFGSQYWLHDLLFNSIVLAAIIHLMNTIKCQV